MNKCCTAALFYPFLSLTIADTLMLLANTLLLGSISSSPPNFIMRLCSFPVMDSPFSIGIQKSMGSSKLDRKYMIGFGVSHKKRFCQLEAQNFQGFATLFINLLKITVDFFSFFSQPSKKACFFFGHLGCVFSLRPGCHYEIPRCQNELLPPEQEWMA